ncbi:MAG: methionine biosynthesis protein MetW [Gammaproteobacteria bacterium]|nr:methionine biosynthesis protein MetW [Gammaproteobacteria bacterium]
MTALRRDLAIISDWIKPNSRILDLGCGNGTLLKHLRDAHGVNGYGLEIDTNKILECLKKDLNVIQTDLDAGLSDFDEESFDYVVMTQTLQAIYHPDKLIEEMLRVGSEGIVTFPNFGHWRARLHIALGGHMPVYGAIPYEWYNTPNIHLCTLSDFEQLCRDKNIKILQREVVTAEHKTSTTMRVLPNLFGELALYRFSRK